MESKKKPTFPKDFFTKLRPAMSLNEALHFKWSEDVLKGKKKAILCSAKNK